MLEKQEIKDIAKANGSHIAIIGNRVYEASKYAPDIEHFTAKKYLLLNHYHAGLTLEESASKAGIEIEKAEEFIESPKATEWLRKQAIRDYVKREWEGGGKWIEMGDKVLEGKKHLSKDQQVVYMAFRDQFLPKARGENESGVTINFNFSTKDVEEAFKRQDSIEAEVQG